MLKDRQTDNETTDKKPTAHLAHLVLRDKKTDPSQTKKAKFSNRTGKYFEIKKYLNPHN